MGLGGCQTTFLTWTTISFLPPRPGKTRYTQKTIVTRILFTQMEKRQGEAESLGGHHSQKWDKLRLSLLLDKDPDLRCVG